MLNLLRVLPTKYARLNVQRKKNDFTVTHNRRVTFTGVTAPARHSK